MKFVKVSNIKTNIDESVDVAFKKAINDAGINSKDILKKKIVKYSIDARHKNDIKKLYTLGFKVSKYDKKRKNVVVTDKEATYEFVPKGTVNLKHRPVIVGFGPAGMFCGYMLAMYGYKPIIIERGSRVDKRLEKIEKYWQTGVLNTESNVQFGEGGAGTFSDGKLNTGIKDKENRIKFVLETLVKNGANENILYDSKPHVGTDILAIVVKNMRQYIEDNGGTVLFDTKLVDFAFEDSRLKSVKLSTGEEIDTEICVLAIGHSARDTFELIYDKGVAMEQKPFAVGVRVEHSQKKINKSQYGFESNKLGAASYKLTYKSDDGRGVYSFCMCPGGYVVSAASEKETCVVNGMSYNSREGKNANSAIVTTVSPKDYPSNHPLAGVEFQRDLEHKAYLECNGKIPVQRLEDFRNNKKSSDFGNIEPAIKGMYGFGNINNVLPDYICKAISEGMEHFENIIEGFNNNDTILSAVESRTSSPVRIIRDDSFQSNIKGIIPAGEGAGYAGGITSAAIDGMKIFEYIANTYNDFS